MAFTFQINNDLKFNHDEKLLKKSEQNRPEIVYEKKSNFNLVKLVKDESKLEGVGTQAIDQDISDCSLKREDSIILDFGEHMVGTFQIDIDQTGSPMDAPLFMRLKFAEMPCELKAKSSDYNGWLSRSWIQEEFIHLDTLPTTLLLPRRYSFRYVEIKVIDTSPKWQAVFSNPLVTTQTSADYSRLEKINLEDTTLQKIYDVGLKTLADCMQDVFEDGPKRDRRLWLGDLRLQALANYASFDQVDLVKRCLYLFAGMTSEDGKISANVFVSPKVVPDDTFLYEYSLFFISTLYDFHKAHPDIEFVKELYPIAKTQMDLTLTMFDKNGQFMPSEEYPVFVDWSNDFNKDTAGYAETIYVLRQFIELSKECKEEVSSYKDQLLLLTNYAKKNLYNQEKHLFMTNQDEYNIASQVWMILAHVLSDEENKLVMQKTMDTLFPIRDIATPYMYHHIVEAMFEAGLFEEACKLLKDYWGKMIDLGADTFWEAFDPGKPDYSPYGSPIVNSYCHAWSCTPVYLIKKYIL